MEKMVKERTFFSKGIFEKSFMNSRITTRTMTTKEKLLGFLLGPLGMLAFQGAVNQLLELYLTSVFYVDQIFGTGTYLVLTYVSRAIGVIAGLVLAYIIEHNVSSQGKIRPIVLLSSLGGVVSGFAVFCIPGSLSNIGKLVWLYVFYILYNSIFITGYGCRVNMLTLTTRSYKERTQIGLFGNVASYMIVGVAVNMIVGSVLYYSFLITDMDGKNWVIVLGIFAMVALPLIFVEYFYTKERVTMELREQENQADTSEEKSSVKSADIPGLWESLKSLFTNRYWLLAFIMNTVINCVNSLSGYNLANNYYAIVLGANAENQYALILTILSGLPMGVGILAIYPLCRRFTIRKVTMFGAVVNLIGIMLCMLDPQNIVLALIGAFISNVGILPMCYIINVLICSTNDSVEYKSGFRPEGTLAVAIATNITGILAALLAGVYETGLSHFGYTGNPLQVQSQGVVNWILFIRFGIPAVEYVIVFILLFFLTIEKEQDKMLLELKERHRAAALAKGEEWTDPDELARREEEENARIAEEARIADLRELCRKKGLDFEKENQKYLDKLNKKKSKRS